MAKKSNRENNESMTPLMRQYNSIKAKYPDALLLFRVGDFYETFGNDAIIASDVLNIVLTKRANGRASSIELAGFPHHSLDTYLPKLVRAGYRVAICDQLEDPKLAKTIVKRGVTELVTPGVSYNDKILDAKENNFLAAIHLRKDTTGISFLDISTGEFYVAQGSNEYIEKLLQTFSPSEVILQKNKRNEFEQIFGSKFYFFYFEDWVFQYDFSYNLLKKHFKTTSLKGFGVNDLKEGIIAAGVALYYLSETHHDETSHICKISRVEEDKYVWLDKFTIRNLELLPTNNKEYNHSLLGIIDSTITPMGARLLKRWLLLPLKDKTKIEQRQSIVDYMINNDTFSENINSNIKQIGDIERLIGKVAIGRVSPREILQLNKALVAIVPIKALCNNTNVEALVQIGEKLNPCSSIAEMIEKSVKSDAPAVVSKGNVIRSGVSEELDELRGIAISGKDYLANIQQREIAATGIPSLKIGFNNVFGYYLEVTNTHKDKVPTTWQRKQTLVNAERYITEELKEYEQKILTAEEKILELEQELFENVVRQIGEYIEPIQLNAYLISQLDCLQSFAQNAKKYNYCKPTIDNSFSISITEGRHPVIERHLPPDNPYISNDVFLDNQTQQIIILTGPNMSGKSAFLRQTALITLMAQIGSYVPAKDATIGIVDKIFTRVGASDNISSGESTFMVEMNEAASILNNMSNRSLILLDEIGRGTSTYDGISIARSITEYMHEHPFYKPKVLFATHYHELNEIANSYERVKNFHVEVKEIGKQVIFLRKISEGGSEHSFGIHVARMAGMPELVIKRAEDLLKQLEKLRISQPESVKTSENKKQKDSIQLSFYQMEDPLLLQIRDDILKIDINTLTPVEALMKLNEIKKLLKNY
ncbi:MAG: DNA mismatch repair protein MutS [Bacteroidales bacterium]|jgi:DNA mismatch repair protein MutS